MTDFIAALRTLLERTGPHTAAPPPAMPAPDARAPAPGIDPRRQEWFERLAEERVMPLLRGAAEEMAKCGIRAAARLREADGRLVAELEVRPPGIPAGARPPLLTITAARPPRHGNAPATHDRTLLVEHTGSFPGVGAGGSFGAEVEYDTINAPQLEERVYDFVRLASGV